MENIRVLVVSKNETLKRNMEEWFHTKVEAGIITIDFAGSREEAECLMVGTNYDKIFHNGIYVIDAIERLQVGSDVYMFGKTNNNLNHFVENPHDKKKISRIFGKNYLKTVYNIGAALGSVITVVLAVIAFIVFNVSARHDIDKNTDKVIENSNKIEKLDSKVDKVKEVSSENNTILRLVFGDEIKNASAKKNKSTIGDNDG